MACPDAILNHPVERRIAVGEEIHVALRASVVDVSSAFTIQGCVDTFDELRGGDVHRYAFDVLNTNPGNAPWPIECS
jgi:hypothetical protein